MQFILNLINSKKKEKKLQGFKLSAVYSTIKNTSESLELNNINKNVDKKALKLDFL